MSRAACLCGAVAWEVDAASLEFMYHCHCSRCRKAHGSAFATLATGPADSFRLQGGGNVVRFEPSPGLSRTFCGRCGSAVPGGPHEGRVSVPAGNFDDDPGVRPLAHIFAASKATWFEIEDTLPRFDVLPEGFDAPVLPDRIPLDPPEGVRGSCLCGGVTYVVTSPPLRCWNCHCGRCRRARSAAYASNLFTSVDGVRFTRGEDRLLMYKVPEAQLFTHVFCRTCGSTMPRLDRGRGLAVIPMGSLDDDPGIRPQRHIFVASKAPWYEIADSLPQHDEGPPSV